MNVERLQSPKQLDEPKGLIVFGWVIPFLFVVVEIIFIANVRFLLGSPANLPHYASAAAFQVCILNAAVCFWKLWSRDVIRNRGGQCLDLTRLYLSAGLLSMFIMLFILPEITSAALLLKHAAQ